MPQVSRRYLKPWVEKRMWEVLEETLVKIKNPPDAHNFLIDLLTGTERIMVAKRLAIAILLFKDYDYRQICEILKVSSATVLSVFKQICISGVGYRKAADQIESDRQRRDFFKTLEKEIWKLFAGSRTVKKKIEASYHRQKFFHDSSHL